MIRTTLFRRCRCARPVRMCHCARPGRGYPFRHQANPGSGSAKAPSSSRACREMRPHRWNLRPMSPRWRANWNDWATARTAARMPAKSPKSGWSAISSVPMAGAVRSVSASAVQPVSYGSGVGVGIGINLGGGNRDKDRHRTCRDHPRCKLRAKPVGRPRRFSRARQFPACRARSERADGRRRAVQRLSRQ